MIDDDGSVQPVKEMVNKIYDMSGNRVNSTPPVYNLRICLIGSDDLDIKNIETFGVAEDGFFMVKAKSNPKFPIFMTNPCVSKQ